MVKLPSWRPFTWVIVILNILFVVWVISAVGAAECEAEREFQGACEAGTAIGVGIIVGFWAVVDIILGILWLVTRGSRRQCPQCGYDVKKGQMTCKKCGYDFRQQPTVA